jgi:hypothetical protein
MALRVIVAAFRGEFWFPMHIATECVSWFRADEKLTAFAELEAAVRACASNSRLNYTCLTSRDS